MSRFAPGFLKQTITPGSTSYATAGTYSFSWPDADTVTIDLWGAGASGGGSGFTPGTFFLYTGTDGGASTIAALSLVANGGLRGGSGAANTTTTAGTSTGMDGNGTGGTASGGNTLNTTGSTGDSALVGPNGNGGDAGDAAGTGGLFPGGGAAGNPGSSPGGGGAAGNRSGIGGSYARGGGGGGHVEHVVSGGLFAPGTAVSIVIGAKGVHRPSSGASSMANGGDGADGKATISWS